jgi:hypothetical protein
MRYFRAIPAVYAAVCEQLDLAYGYPNYEMKTLRTLPLASELPGDDQGRVYLAIEKRFCEFDLPSQLLPELLSSGMVEEITAAQFDAVDPHSIPPKQWV